MTARMILIACAVLFGAVLPQLAQGEASGFIEVGKRRIEFRDGFVTRDAQANSVLIWLFPVVVAAETKRSVAKGAFDPALMRNDRALLELGFKPGTKEVARFQWNVNFDAPGTHFAIPGALPGGLPNAAINPVAGGAVRFRWRGERMHPSMPEAASRWSVSVDLPISD